MASNTRKQLEAWLKTLDVEGRVVDIGGITWPVEGRTKSWKVSKYDIVDVKKTHKNREAEYAYDLNYLTPLWAKSGYDVAFCLEVMQFVWNPYYVIENIADNLRKGGLLYISTHLSFPQHKGTDCLRYTRLGICKLLEGAGFKIKEIVPLVSCAQESLETFYKAESKVVYYPEEIGHLVTAIK